MAARRKGRAMNYRALGNTGLKVSEIGFGGEWLGGTPETAAADDALLEFKRKI